MGNKGKTTLVGESRFQGIEIDSPLVHRVPSLSLAHRVPGLVLAHADTSNILDPVEIG